MNKYVLTVITSTSATSATESSSAAPTSKLYGSRFISSADIARLVSLTFLFGIADTEVAAPAARRELSINHHEIRVRTAAA